MAYAKTTGGNQGHGPAGPIVAPPQTQAARQQPEIYTFDQARAHALSALARLPYGKGDVFAVEPTVRVDALQRAVDSELASSGQDYRADIGLTGGQTRYSTDVVLTKRPKGVWD